MLQESRACGEFCRLYAQTLLQRHTVAACACRRRCFASWQHSLPRGAAPALPSHARLPPPPPRGAAHSSKSSPASRPLSLPATRPPKKHPTARPSGSAAVPRLQRRQTRSVPPPTAEPRCSRRARSPRASSSRAALGAPCASHVIALRSPSPILTMCARRQSTWRWRSSTGCSRQHRATRAVCSTPPPGTPRCAPPLRTFRGGWSSRGASKHGYSTRRCLPSSRPRPRPFFGRRMRRCVHSQSTRELRRGTSHLRSLQATDSA